MDGDRDQFWIIDGHSMIYRAVFRRGEPLTSPTGEPTRGTYYFCRMLFAMIQEFEPAYLAMAVDVPRDTTWRRKMYSDYKANRDRGEPLEEVVIQKQRITEIVGRLGIPIIGAEGHEADDVIATLVDICAGPEVECVVCSRDKDMHQLIGPDCRMYDAQAREWVDERAVVRRWGVPVEHVVEVQTLAGDTTDNVPGVRGLGLKKASALVQEYGTVSTLVANEKRLTPAVRRALGEADLSLCRKLVELRRDVPIDFSVEDLEFDGFDMEAVTPIFKKLGFSSMIK